MVVLKRDLAEVAIGYDFNCLQGFNTVSIFIQKRRMYHQQGCIELTSKQIFL